MPALKPLRLYRALSYLADATSPAAVSDETRDFMILKPFPIMPSVRYRRYDIRDHRGSGCGDDWAASAGWRGAAAVRDTQQPPACLDSGQEHRGGRH